MGRRFFDACRGIMKKPWRVILQGFFETACSVLLRLILLFNIHGFHYSHFSFPLFFQSFSAFNPFSQQ